MTKTATAPKPAETLSPADRAFVLFTARVNGANLAELRKLAREAGIKSGGVKKADLAAALLAHKDAELTAEQADAPAAEPAAEPAKAPKADPTAKTLAKTAPKGKRPAVLTPCLCGCGKDVANRFAQGHDARFAGQLVRKWEAKELTRSKAIATAQKVSDALGRKVIRGIEVREERAAKKAAAAKAAKKGATK